MFSQIFKVFGVYRVESNAFLWLLGSHSELFCKSPTQLKRLNESPTNYPPLGINLGLKHRSRFFAF